MSFKKIIFLLVCATGVLLLNSGVAYINAGLWNAAFPAHALSPSQYGAISNIFLLVVCWLFLLLKTLEFMWKTS